VYSRLVAIVKILFFIYWFIGGYILSYKDNIYGKERITYNMVIKLYEKTILYTWILNT